MNFNKHLDVGDRHAFLSPSQNAWVNYTDQKLEARFFSHTAARRGTAIHLFATNAIKLRIKISKANPTLSMYVNDAIAYDMEVEQPLYYSDNAFGTADAISFRRNTLRIHDLKTGLVPTSFRQLEVYAALFCLEYNLSPFDIKMEFRIYQNKEVKVLEGDPEIISYIMDKIIDFDMKIEMLKERGEL